MVMVVGSSLFLDYFLFFPEYIEYSLIDFKQLQIVAYLAMRNMFSIYWQK